MVVKEFEGDGGDASHGTRTLPYSRFNAAAYLLSLTLTHLLLPLPPFKLHQCNINPTKSLLQTLLYKYAFKS